MRKALLFVFILLSQYARAQDPYEYYYNNSRLDEQSPELNSDMRLFLRPLGRRDLFLSLAEFNFSAVKYNRRGYSGLRRERWGNVDFSGLLSSSPDYMLTSALRRSQSARTSFSDGWFAGVNEYPTDAAELFTGGFSASAFAYNRRGRLGARVSLAGDTGETTYGGIMLHHRWGRDSKVDGVFTQETSLLAGFDLEPAKGHRLSFVLGATNADNGLRTYAVREAFELTGNNYYNPSWGYYDGEQRSSKTFGKLNFFPMVNYTGAVAASTTISVSAFMRYGEERRGGLSWFGAQTPYPDYYRYMPGYEPSNPAAAWRTNDARVTQIF